MKTPCDDDDENDVVVISSSCLVALNEKTRIVALQCKYKISSNFKVLIELSTKDQIDLKSDYEIQVILKYDEQLNNILQLFIEYTESNH